MITITFQCRVCDARFEMNPERYKAICGGGMLSMPKRCPRCADADQQRPEVTLSRKCLWEGNVRILSLPKREWIPFEAAEKDFPASKMTVKGSAYGASWTGRIDIFTHLDPLPQTGDIVKLEELETEKRVAYRKVRRGHISRYAPPQTIEKEKIALEEVGEREETDEVTTESRIYLYLSHADGAPIGELVWATAYTKTTLKGFGRQFHAHIGGHPVRAWEISGGVRSGRLRTQGVLATVNRDNPLVKTFREGGAVASTETIYIPSDADPIAQDLIERGRSRK